MSSIPTWKQLSAVLTGFALVASAAAQVRTTARPATRITAKVDSAVTTRLAGTHPEVVAHATSVKHLASSTRLAQLHLVLNSTDEQIAALKSMSDQQQDKSSPNYHKWMTPEAFGASFGASSTDVAKIVAWMQDQGLSVDSVSKSNRMITFSGTSGQIEAAFHTQMSQLQVNGENHVSNTTDIAVPAAFAGVVRGVARLNDFYPTAPTKKVGLATLKTLVPAGNYVSQDAKPLYGAATGTHYVSPGDEAIIYNTTPLLNAGNDGTGQTISILAQSNITLSDVETFRSIFGLSKNDPTIVVVGQDPGQNQDDGEAYLDAEWSGALAPGANVKFLVSAPSLEGGGIDAAGLYAVDNNIGDIISLSYGGCETNNGAAGTAFWNTLWEQAAAQGQTAMVSSGDSGAGGCDSSSATASSGTYGVNALGSSAYNVAVGGSMFVDFGQTPYWGSTGTAVPFINALSYIPEAPLDQSRVATTYLNAGSTAYTTGTGVFGAGGGISIYTARPNWQTGSGIATADPVPVAPATGTGIAPGSPITGPHRLVPDLVNISASGHDPALYCADEICAVTTTGGLVNAGLVGGTSVATPVQAGIQALINQKNGGRQGNANYYYYRLANAQYTASTTACQSTLGTAANPNVTLPAATCNFHDIVTGNINVPTATSGSAQIGFNAGVGFDVASGLGSMNVANVAANWSSVTFTATTTTLGITPAITTHGSAQTINVTVAPTTGTGTPTGDFSIIAETTNPNGPFQYTLTNGAFTGTIGSNGVLNTTVSTAALPGGSYKIHAHYSGDLNFGGSDSASIPVTIGTETPTVQVTSYNITTAGAVNQATTFAYGADVYVDTYVIPASNAGVPTGTVTYTVSRNGVAIAPLTTTLDPTGNTYFMAGVSFVSFYLKANYTALTPGNYVLTAAYSGDASYKAASTSTSFTVTPLTPTVTFTAPANITSGATATFGYSITNPTTVANPNTTVAATGTVTFVDTTTSTTLGTATLTNGSATFSTTGITASGANSITATYSGDVQYASAVNTATVTVGTLTAPTVTVTTTGTLTVGATVTLRATLNPTTATGTVTFFDGTTPLGTGNLSGGVASFAYAAFTGGAHTINAAYSGSTANAGATGSASITIAQNTTTLRIGTSTAATYGQVLVVDAYLGRNPTTTGQAPVQPTGLITIYEGSTALGSGTPFFEPGGYNYYGTAIPISLLSAGSHVLTAIYAGDASFKAATASYTVTVNIAALTPAVTVSAPSTVYAKGSSVTLTAVIPAASNFATPTGPLTFFDNGTSIGTGTLAYSASAGGFVATLTTSALTAGVNNITVQLTADTNYSAVTSAGFTITLPTNNVWIANSNGTVSGVTSSGTAVTGSAVSGGGTAISIDNSGNIWSINKSASNVTEISNTGATKGTFSTGGINTPTALTIDGAGYIWITNGNDTLSVLTPSGTAFSTTAYTSLLSGATSINVDGSGNLWITNATDGSVSEVIGAAAPVTTPTTTAVKNNTLAVKP